MYRLSINIYFKFSFLFQKNKFINDKINLKNQKLSNELTSIFIKYISENNEYYFNSMFFKFSVLFQNNNFLKTKLKLDDIYEIVKIIDIIPDITIKNLDEFDMVIYECEEGIVNPLLVINHIFFLFKCAINNTKIDFYTIDVSLSINVKIENISTSILEYKLSKEGFTFTRDEFTMINLFEIFIKSFLKFIEKYEVESINSIKLKTIKFIK